MADKFVSPSGSDSNDGSEGSPYLTVEKGLVNVSNGETVWLRGNAGNFAAQTIDTSSASGADGDPKFVRAYPDEQAVIAGRLLIHNVLSYVYFIGHEDVRLGRTQDTIRVVNTTDGQHVVEMYGTGNRLEGLDIDGGTQDRSDGSLVSLGWNGQTGQWRAIDAVITKSLLQNIGVTPGLPSGDPGHNHGIYPNYNLNNEISYNVIRNIQGGWGLHLYSESGSARDVDDTWIHHNTIYDTSHGGIALASDGTSTTENTVVDNNLFVDCGNPSLTWASYSFWTFWGGVEGTGNTGSDNHSHNPGDDHVDPDLSGWTLEAPSTGDPLFVDAANGDFRLQAGSPAAGMGAFPDVGTPRRWVWRF